MTPLFVDCRYTKRDGGGGGVLDSSQMTDRRVCPLRHQSMEDESAFTELLRNIYTRHSNVVPMVAAGVASLKASKGGLPLWLHQQPATVAWCVEWVDPKPSAPTPFCFPVLTMATGQHIALHEETHEGYVGLICKHVSCCPLSPPLPPPCPRPITTCSSAHPLFTSHPLPPPHHNLLLSTPPPPLPPSPFRPAPAPSQPALEHPPLHISSLPPPHHNLLLSTPPPPLPSPLSPLPPCPRPITTCSSAPPSSPLLPAPAPSQPALEHPLTPFVPPFSPAAAQVSPMQVAQHAIGDARDICIRQYGSAPDVDIYGVLDFTFPYVPEHLHHMVFELVKNSLRAGLSSVPRHCPLPFVSPFANLPSRLSSHR